MPGKFSKGVDGDREGSYKVIREDVWGYSAFSYLWKTLNK